MNIKKIVTGYLEENCYVLEKEEECLIVDPGDDFSKIKKDITKKVVGILITHRHFDHIGALEEVIEEYPAPVYEKINIDEQTYKIGNFEFNVIFAPGHSKDSVVYYFYKEKAMFTGDFLFFHTIGRCDLEGGSMEEMQKSIEKIKKYDEKISIYPGHGKSSTLLEEKINNFYFNN